MGCGQSKIHLYPRKSKSKANGKKAGHADSDAETDEDEGHIEDSEKCQSHEREKNEEVEEQSNKDAAETEEEVSVSLLRAKNLSLLQSQEISSSQQNFFRMLDKKIEEGPDYDSASETEIALEEARLNALVQHWESASITASICSSASRSLQTTPIRQAPIKLLGPTPRALLQNTMPMPLPQQQQQQVLTADFLPHGAPQSTQSTVQSQQQVLHSHMNTKMLHPMTVVQVPQIGISGMLMPPPEISTANSSNAMALLQVTPNHQQFPHLLALPAGSSQVMGKPNVSPKRLIDARLLMNPTPLAQQMQPQMLNPQFMPTPGVISSAPMSSGFVNGGSAVAIAGGGGSAQPSLQMAYFGHQVTASQQNMQLSSTSTQHEVQQQQQTPPKSQDPVQPQSFYGDVIHSVQVPTEYRFPPAISVQRLAPQVQRQLRETQELIKDSCPPQLYATGYGSPGPPIRNQARNPNRRPLETQFSQELS